METLLNADQVAAVLGVCKNTAVRLMEQMNPVDVGTNPKKRYLRVSRAALEAWIARKQQPTMAIKPERRGRKKQPVGAMTYMDQWGRPLRMKNGKLVPGPPPKQA